MTLRKSFSVEKDWDRGLSPRCWRLWVLSNQSALSESSHWGKVLLRELLVLRNPELCSASKLMSSSKLMLSPSISPSVSRSSVSWCCGLIWSTVGVLVLLGTGDVGGVTMTVVPACRVAPSRVRLVKSLVSSLGLDSPFLVLVLRLWSVVDQTMGACPLDCVVPGWFWTGAPLSA